MQENGMVKWGCLSVQHNIESTSSRPRNNIKYYIWFCKAKIEDPATIIDPCSQTQAPLQ